MEELEVRGAPEAVWEEAVSGKAEFQGDSPETWRTWVTVTWMPEPERKGVSGRGRKAIL